jgi:hypothetical protein
MKKILFAIISLFSIVSCDQKGTNESNSTNDSLNAVINNKDSALLSFITSFNEIESNLDSVAAKQKIISVYAGETKGELKSNKKDRINAEIAAINRLMDKNRKEIDELTKKLKGSKGNNAVLEKTIKTLTIQLSQKDYELCEVNLKMDEMNAKVITLVTAIDSITTQNYIQSIIIDYQSLNLHLVYYIVGTEKELVEKKIIDKKGGLLGMGKTSTLSDDFDNTLFTLMDYTKTSEITINGSDVKVVTNHPMDSYTLEKDLSKKGNIKNLTILIPEKFWSVTKYLVIIKK